MAETRELTITKTFTARDAYVYARDVLGGRWIEAEDVLRGSPHWGHYKAFVEKVTGEEVE